MSLMDLQIVVRTIDDATRVFRSISENVGQIGKAAGEVGSKFSAVTKEAGALATKLGVLGGAAIWAFKSQFVDTAAEFEKFRTVLETVEGSSLKAKYSMNWISNFAAKTPYELAEVTDSFVKLRAYGMQPTNGLLKSLGDTASAMGKPLEQAVEAIADAVTGENERLKEFGIKGTIVGNKIRYEYSYNGRQMVKEANKNSRAMIESTLTSIFNQKYAGAMDKQSKTWIGMMSNISDQWTRFTNMVMEAGVFDFLKSKLGELLSRVDALAKSGQLKKWADQFGSTLVTGLKNTWQIGQQLVPVFAKWGQVIDEVAHSVGGYGKVAQIVLALMSLKLIGSTGLFLKSLFDLGGTVVGIIWKIARFTKVLSGLNWLWQEIQWAVLGIAVAFGIPVWTAGLLVAAIVGIIAAIIIFRKQIWSALKFSYDFVKQTFMKIVNFMSSVKDKMFNAGANIMKSLWEGMKAFANKPVEAIRKVVQDIRNHLPFSPAKVGPLRDIHKIKLIETIASNIKPYPMIDAMNKALSATRQNIEAKIAGKSLLLKTNSQSNSSSMTVHFSPNITIQGGNSQSKEDLIKSLKNELLPEFERTVRNLQAKKERLAY